MISETEWNIINNILLELYTIDSLEVLSQKLMKVIRMLIPYTKGYFILLDEEQNIREKESYFTGFNTKAERLYMNKYYNDDYIRYLYDIKSETNVYRDTNILESAIREKTDFYVNFLKPEDIVFGCGILIIKNGRVIGIFNLFRNEPLKDFTDKELKILDILKKHLENMIYNVTQLSRAKISVNKNLNAFAAAFYLTDRESEVLSLINKGYSNQKIADELAISLSTVKKHVYNLFGKTGVANRSQLISLFLK